MLSHKQLIWKCERHSLLFSSCDSNRIWMKLEISVVEQTRHISYRRMTHDNNQSRIQNFGIIYAHHVTSDSFRYHEYVNSMWFFILIFDLQVEFHRNSISLIHKNNSFFAFNEFIPIGSTIIFFLNVFW